MSAATNTPAPDTPRAQGFRMPAEWEPHAATWLAWPHERSDWPGKFDAVPWVFAEIARLLQDGERIRMLVNDRAEQRRVGKLLGQAGVDLGRVDFFRLPTDRSWTRDYLPSFVVRGGEGRGKREVRGVKWRFNGWARYRNYQRDEQAGIDVLQELGMAGWQPETVTGRRRRQVVLEGGAFDVDGQGTLLATEQCLITSRYARNPELGKLGLERVLSECLGIDKVIWLSEGIVGDDTSGHIDDFARFVAPGRVVVAEEPNRKDDNHALLRQAQQRLKKATDARGRQLDVIGLPMPAPVTFAGQRLPASYANFYVGNSVVLVPTFNDPNDRRALDLFAELFPGRRVVGVFARDLVLGLGTLHCSTQQEPAGG